MHSKLYARKGHGYVYIDNNEEAGGIYLAPMVAAYDLSLKRDCYAIILLYITV